MMFCIKVNNNMQLFRNKENCPLTDWLGQFQHQAARLKDGNKVFEQQLCRFGWGEGKMLKWSCTSSVYICVCMWGWVINAGSGGRDWISFLICDHLAPPAAAVLPQCLMGFTKRSPLLETHCHLILSDNQLQWSPTHMISNIGRIQDSEITSTMKQTCVPGHESNIKTV